MTIFDNEDAEYADDGYATGGSEGEYLPETTPSAVKNTRSQDMTHPDTLQRAAFEAWYDSGAENRDEFMALVDAALQPQATPPDPADLLRDALSNLNDLADQKNAGVER